MTRAIVYLLVNTSNGKKYVGKTKKTLARRWEDHCRAVTRGSKYAIHRAIRKYGQNVFTREVLGEYGSEAKALTAEKRWIVKLKTMGAGGYNMCTGGRGAIGYRMTAKARAKLRNFAKGRDMSAVLAKSIESRKKNGLSAKAKANISAAQRKRHREHPRSVETRRKLSVANKGRQNYWLVGVPRTEEAKLKMSLAKKKQNAKRRHKPHTAIEKKLHHLLYKLNISASDVAAMCEVSRATIFLWASGKVTPSEKAKALTRPMLTPSTKDMSTR